MDSLLFAVKTLFFTFLVVILMQIKWGDSTIEIATYDFLTSSQIISPVENVANGAVKFLRNSWVKVTKSINTNFTNALRSENQPGQRHLNFGIERSQAYVEEVKARSVETFEAGQVSDEKNNIVEKIKSKVSGVSQNIKKKFIDETEVPKATNPDKSSARHTNLEDESIEGE